MPKKKKVRRSGPSQEQVSQATSARELPGAAQAELVDGVAVFGVVERQDRRRHHDGPAEDVSRLEIRREAAVPLVVDAHVDRLARRLILVFVVVLVGGDVFGSDVKFCEKSTSRPV